MDYNEENINKNPEDAIIQIGQDRGKRIGDGNPDELRKIYDNLHGLKEKNSATFPTYEVFHDKLEQFLGSSEPQEKEEE